MVQAAGVTHPGRVRKINEDCWLADHQLGLFVVADGMGGHNAGEVASKLAVEAIRGFLSRTMESEDFTWPYGIDPALSFDANRLSTAVKLANRRVFKLGESRDDYTGMGSTVVAAFVHQNRTIYASVGDSRIYAFNRRLEQLTADDSWIAEFLAREPEMRREALANHPLRHVLTNVVGARETLELKVQERPVRENELLLLCSDGLHGAVDVNTIERILAVDSPVEAITEQLLNAVLAGHAEDNITAVVIRT
jgi:PPM family protein phosphatase